MTGHTLGDPRIVHAGRNQEKILYWEDIECSDNHPVDDWINVLSSHYPSFIIYSVTRTKPRFHERHGWWLGLVFTVTIGIIFGVFGLA